MKRVSVGCDLGATNLRVAVVSESGAILASSREALTDSSPEVVAKDLKTMVDQVLALAQVSWDQLHGVGVGLAGQVAGSSGVILVGPNLGWRNVPFGELVKKEIGRAPKLVNDLSAAAWGESRIGAAQGVDDAVVVFLGSGLGAGLILSGRLYEGTGGTAGELGHVVVRQGGRRCGCGERGCLEAYVGGHNVELRLKEMVAAGEAAGILEAAGGEVEKVGPHSLELAVSQGDPTALAFVGEMAELLGWALGNLVTILNPRRLILGGGMFHGLSSLRPLVQKEIFAVGRKAQLDDLSIVESALGDDAGLVGAGLLAFT